MAHIQQNKRLILLKIAQVLSKNPTISMTMIAKEVGISRTSLFTEFGTKETIVDAIFEEHRKLHEAIVSSYLTESDWFSAIKSTIRTTLENRSIIKVTALPTFTSSRRKQVSLYRKRFWEDYAAFFKRGKDEGFLLGSFSEMEMAGLFATIIWGIIEQMDYTDMPLTDAVTFVCRALLEGIRRPSEVPSEGKGLFLSKPHNV